RHGVHLFCDEMYRGLEYNPARRIPSAVDLYERASVLGGLSKTYALPGLRIGWLATKDANLFLSIHHLKDYTTICHSAPSEILGIITLRNGVAIIQRSLDIIRTNLGAAETFFSKYPNLFEWLPPQAGSIAFSRYLGPGSVENLCQNALEQQGVMIVPGSLFDYPGNYFRVGLGRKNFNQALNQFDKMLQINPFYQA
ncbi:MAG: aminotransferase class, partial [Chloroflexi bacterium]|nr:aminotransferase class [Chloroflexota bacterium]